jgi:transaldolase
MVSLEDLVARLRRRVLWAARDLFARAARPNLFIKIPGTKESLPAVEEAIFAGIPINVTLLFSREQYLAAAEAFLRGIERRLDAGLNPNVGSVASIFVSRWDAALRRQSTVAVNQLRIAVASARTGPRALYFAPLAPNLQRRSAPRRLQTAPASGIGCLISKPWRRRSP